MQTILNTESKETTVNLSESNLLNQLVIYYLVLKILEEEPEIREKIKTLISDGEASSIWNIIHQIIFFITSTISSINEGENYLELFTKEETNKKKKLLEVISSISSEKCKGIIQDLTEIVLGKNNRNSDALKNIYAGVYDWSRTLLGISIIES